MACRGRRRVGTAVGSGCRAWLGRRRGGRGRGRAGERRTDRTDATVRTGPPEPDGGDQDRGQEDACSGDARARRHAPDADPLRRRGRTSGAGRRPRPTRAGSDQGRDGSITLSPTSFGRGSRPRGALPPSCRARDAASSYVAPSMAVMTSADRSSGDSSLIAAWTSSQRACTDASSDAGSGARQQAPADPSKAVGGEATHGHQEPREHRPIPIQLGAVVPEPQVRLLGEVFGLGPVVRPGESETEDVGPVRLEDAVVGEFSRAAHRHPGGHIDIHDEQGRNARSRPETDASRAIGGTSGRRRAGEASSERNILCGSGTVVPNHSGNHASSAERTFHPGEHPVRSRSRSRAIAQTIIRSGVCEPGEIVGPEHVPHRVRHREGLAE